MYIVPWDDAAAPLEHRDLVERRFDGPVLSGTRHGLQGVYVVPEAGGIRARRFVGLTWRRLGVYIIHMYCLVVAVAVAVTVAVIHTHVGKNNT